ncbi:MAG: carboxypeptidase regulatory-like domain-containing protein [Planctomycetes bacterium]|nr:carboxypeptidase regulatory-like domain-containing protein [Planctomycetota bacterium]
MPLDHELELKLWADDHRFQVHRVTVKGPTREGEEQELRVVLRDLPVLTGRLLSLAGEPMPKQRFLAAYDDPWRGLVSTEATTNDAGRFRVQLVGEPLSPLPRPLRAGSAEPCEVVRVSAHAPGRALREVVRAAPGEQGLRLVLAPGASIRGSVMLDSKRTAASVRVGLIDAQSQTKRTPLHPDGRFRFSGIRPGVYSLELRAAQGLLLARVDGIELEEGLDAEDPRLAAIDLRGRFATLQLRLRDERGDALVRKQGTWWSAHDAAEIFSWTTDEQGELKLCVPLELSEIAVAREGGLPQRVLVAPGGQDLRLAPGLATKLELAQRVELPGGMELVAVLEPARSRASFALPPLRFAFGGPVAEGLLPTAGRYRVRWQLRVASLAPREQACGEAQEIDVDRAGDRGYARVEPPEEEELRRAIEESLR